MRNVGVRCRTAKCRLKWGRALPAHCKWYIRELGNNLKGKDCDCMDLCYGICQRHVV